jgi:CheY-like chemotaxis protein
MSEGASDVSVTIEDTGPGLQPQLIPHLFERFRQGGGATAHAKGGLGLGLAIVKDLVALQGGTVSAANRSFGQGAAFDVVLPRVRSSDGPHDEAQGPERSARTGLTDLRVLVVDDEEDTREVVEFLLRSHGARVTTAACVRDALRIVQTKIPDIVLTDIAMPDEDGFELLERLKAFAIRHGLTIPAAAISAHANPHDRARMRAAGFLAHIPKPIDPAVLTRTVIQLAAEHAPAAAGRRS